MRYGNLIIFIFIFTTAYSQTDRHTVNLFTTHEGLSNNTIYSILHDSRGFLWIGTNEGLNRFDGFQFKKYFFEKNNPHSLPHDNIFDILEYRVGQLLIATSNGLGVLNTLTGQFENEKIGFASLRAGSGTNINSMYQDKEANIWINHDGELDILDSNLLYLYRFTDLDWARNLKGVLIRYEHWFTDAGGRLWLPSDTSGIHVIDFNAKKVYNGRNNPQQLSYFRSRSIRAFLVDEKHHALWYAPWGEGLIRYNFITGTSQQELFGTSEPGEARTVNSMLKTGDDELLCFMNGKCYKIDEATFQHKLLIEKSSFNDPGNNIITSLTINDAGNNQCWIGSSNGLYQLSEEKKPYKELTLVRPDKSSPDCTDMVLSRSGSLYCTYSDDCLVEVQENRKDIAFHKLPGHSNNILKQVAEDRLGRIWIGSKQGIYLFDPVKKIFTRPDLLPAELLYLNINVVFCDKDGDTWITTREPFGLYHYNAGTNMVQKVNNPVINHFETLGIGSRISAIVEDRQGDLWMSSRLGGGIIYYEKKKDRWKLYPPSGRNFSSLVNKGLSSLCAGDGNFLWFASQFGDGLIRYDYKNDSVVRFTRHDGLLSNNILNIIVDNTNKLWLITEDGISKFNPGNFRSQNVTLINNPFHTTFLKGIFDQSSNDIVIGIDNRLLFIPADSSVNNTNVASPLIDRVVVNNEQQFFEPGHNELKLSSQQKNISIDFTAVHFSGNGNTRFAYRLSNIDEDWKFADDNRIVQYAALAPGRYTFFLKAGNENNIWNPELATFSFVIKPQWWQTWGFRVAAFLLFSVVIIFFVRRRIKNIRHEAGMKQQIAESEMIALRAQMDPHFIFNCLNSIDNLIQNNEKEKATAYLARFAKLIRAILENSKSKVIPCWKDIETLQLYLDMEELRWDKKIACSIIVADDIQNGDYKVPPMAIQPFVENAIHHGLLNKVATDKKLDIKIGLEGNKIKYTITDNGVGRSKAEEYKKLNRSSQISLGIQLTKNRINLFNQDENGSVKITDLYDEDKQPGGTRVEVWLAT